MMPSLLLKLLPWRLVFRFGNTSLTGPNLDNTGDDKGPQSCHECQLWTCPSYRSTLWVLYFPFSPFSQVNTPFPFAASSYWNQYFEILFFLPKCWVRKTYELIWGFISIYSFKVHVYWADCISYNKDLYCSHMAILPEYTSAVAIIYH